MVFEHPYTSKWGKSTFLQFLLTPILDEEGQVSLVQLMIEDISERKQAEARIRKLNRMLQVISQVNETLVRAVDESELMQQVCQILVEVGGYRLAWIGLARQDKRKSVTAEAVAGFDEGYVEQPRHHLGEFQAAGVAPLAQPSAPASQRWSRMSRPIPALPPGARLPWRAAMLP